MRCKCSGRLEIAQIALTLVGGQLIKDGLVSFIFLFNHSRGNAVISMADNGESKAGESIAVPVKPAVAAAPPAKPPVAAASRSRRRKADAPD